ncbi:methyl-accepting chemotaxis protein [Planctomycetota bacterium]
MGVFKKWKSLTIRTKVNMLILPAILPVLIVAWMTYGSYRNAALQSNEHITQLIVNEHARGIGNFLHVQDETFRTWAADDVYGMSVEFETFNELSDKFGEMLAAAPGMCLLALTDTKGKVLAAAGNPGSDVEKVKSLIGHTSTELTTLAQTPEPAVALSASTLLPVLGYSWQQTYVFAAPCKDSSENRNSMLVAYVNWSLLEAHITQTQEVLVNKGWVGTQSLLLDKSTEQVLAHSDPQRAGQPFTAGNDVIEWLNVASHALATSAFTIEDTVQYLTFAPVPDAVSLTNGQEDVSETTFCIAVLIPQSDVLAGVKAVLQFTLITVIVASIFLCGLFWIVSRGISKEVHATANAFKDIAEGEGDLTKRLPVHSETSELGRLTKYFNRFVEKLQTTLKDVSANAQTVDSSSSGMVEISATMTAGAQESSAKSETVAAAAEEMSSNMNSVAAAMEQASTNVGLVATAAEQMTSTIDEIASNTEKARTITTQAVTEAQSAAEKINELGDSAQDIGKVTETITEISEQTNLLALNATIEAARAGDAGKGFAVVANEIKELANQTANATEDIRAKINGIQSKTGDTVTEIARVGKIIEQVNEIVATIASAVEEQSATTRQIAGNVTQASTGIGEVNENVAQTTVVSGEIAREIAQVNETSSTITNNSQQVNSSATELSKLAEELNRLVGQFKV